MGKSVITAFLVLEMTEILINATLIGILIAIPLSFLSYFVVMRKMTFAGVGIAHASFGGIALGFLLGCESFIFPLVFCVVSSLFIGFLYKKGGFSEDSVIDVVFVFSMAFGIFILSLSNGYSGNVLGLLFGDILSVNKDYIVPVIGIFLLSMFFISYFFSHLNLITYNEDLARINGVRVDLLYYFFWIVLSVLIVFSIRLIGIVLVNAFLVLPTLVGLNVSKNFKGVIGVGILSSIISVAGGVILSYYVNTPTGATIVLLFFAFWILSFIFKI